MVIRQPFFRCLTGHPQPELLKRDFDQQISIVLCRALNRQLFMMQSTGDKRFTRLTRDVFRPDRRAVAQTGDVGPPRMQQAVFWFLILL